MTIVVRPPTKFENYMLEDTSTDSRSKAIENIETYYKNGRVLKEGETHNYKYKLITLGTGRGKAFFMYNDNNLRVRISSVNYKNVRMQLKEDIERDIKSKLVEITE